MKRRPGKKGDQEVIERCFNYLKDCMAEHPEVEPTLWAGTFWSILVDVYSSSGMTYEQFTREWDKIKHHCKPWFDQ